MKFLSCHENLWELCSYCVSPSGPGELCAAHVTFSVGDMGSPGFGSVTEIRGPPVLWSGGQKFVIKVWCVLPACAGTLAQAFLTRPFSYIQSGHYQINPHSEVPGVWDPYVRILWNIVQSQSISVKLLRTFLPT